MTRRRPVVTKARSRADAAPMKYLESIRAALRDALADDPTVFLAGIDVAAGGGVFAVSRGLYERFPDRVLDTPISESAVLGLAVGCRDGRP